MARAFRCCGHKLQPERLQPKINLRIHQTTGMNRQEFHFVRTRRDLFGSSNTITWKNEWTTRLLFILRILFGTRSYFSFLERLCPLPLGILKVPRRLLARSGAIHVVQRGEIFLWPKRSVNSRDLIGKREPTSMTSQMEQ